MVCFNSGVIFLVENHGALSSFVSPFSKIGYNVSYAIFSEILNSLNSA